MDAVVSAIRIGRLDVATDRALGWRGERKRCSMEVTAGTSVRLMPAVLTSDATFSVGHDPFLIAERQAAPRGSAASVLLFAKCLTLRHVGSSDFRRPTTSPHQACRPPARLPKDRNASAGSTNFPAMFRRPLIDARPFQG
jgi:hypothetical protein